MDLSVFNICLQLNRKDYVALPILPIIEYGKTIATAMIGKAELSYLIVELYGESEGSYPEA